MKMKLQPKSGMLGTVLALLFLGGCTSLPREDDPYADAWTTVVGSPEWHQSLARRASPALSGRPAHYALPGMNGLDSTEVDPSFLDAYPKLVSRAYFRLIAEARQADFRVRTAYQQSYLEAHREENRDKQAIQRECEMARQRFLAHRRMLEGLVSWRSFHQFGSDDLDYFLKEQLRESYGMHLRGQDEEKIVAHLMNRLADLYHKEHEGAPLYPLF
jgi:hypothetical protein